MNNEQQSSSSNQRIPMGALVRDLASGFEGTVTSRVQWADGRTEFGVQGKTSNPSNYPDAVLISPERLETAGPGIQHLAAQQPLRQFNVNLGSVVQARGIEGTVVGKIDTLDGGTMVLVQGPADAHGRVTSPFRESAGLVLVQKQGNGTTESRTTN